MIIASSSTLLDGLNELARIGAAYDAATPQDAGVTCIRRPDRTLVAVLVDDELPAGTIVDEEL
jgi:hypothetical protein